MQQPLFRLKLSFFEEEKNRAAKAQIDITSFNNKETSVKISNKDTNVAVAVDYSTVSNRAIR